MRLVEYSTHPSPLNNSAKAKTGNRGVIRTFHYWENRGRRTRRREKFLLRQQEKFKKEIPFATPETSKPHTEKFHQPRNIIRARLELIFNFLDSISNPIYLQSICYSIIYLSSHFVRIFSEYIFTKNIIGSLREASTANY
ncbi:hypothetical protein VTL71DRAFT_8556 [Oculimacula yallundae]|uniref:Uncharacterized protein n=1 Tax=Oculimacula yallundae TaxID=86028 RepID=A0ABR4CYY1_9HELO